MKKIDLLNDDLRKIYFKYLIPGITSSLMVALYVFVDTMFVGLGVGSDGLAALNISIPTFTMFTSLFLCIGIGGANILSIKRSRGEFNEGNKIFTNAVSFGFIIGVVISILGFIFAENIGAFLGTNEKIAPLFKDYFSILVSFTWAFLVSGILSIFVRNDKNPKLSMIAAIASNLFNIILDYILIFEFNMGMRGAVIATVSSPIVSILILLTHFRSNNNSLKYLGFKINFRIIFDFLKNGFGTFILEMSRGISILIFNNVIIRLAGDTYVAAYGIILNVSYVIICIFSGIAQSIQPIISSNFGGEKLKRVRKIFMYGSITAVCIGIISYLFFYLFPENVVRLFTTNNEMLIKITVEGMRIYFIGCMFICFNIITIYFFQSINRAVNSIIISLSSGVLFVIIGFYILVEPFGIKGVWMVFPFGELMTLFVSIILIFKNYSRLKEKNQ